MTTLTVSNNYHPEVLSRFNSDVEDHEMTVLHDYGLYRHLRFKKPGTGMYYFDIITTPGQLTIRGDMGTYVFAREEDMFPWFNGRYVNAGYWSEKLQAIDRQGGVKEFDERLFRQRVIEYFWERREDFEPRNAAYIWDAIRTQIFGGYVDRHDAGACHALLQEFVSPVTGFAFVDSWDWGGFDDYGFHFLWCCHAILWGIKQYFAPKAIT